MLLITLFTVDFDKDDDLDKNKYVPIAVNV